MQARDTSRWAMFAHGLSMPAKGRAYELWLVTKDRKIPAGMFVPRDDGSAVIHASYAMTPGDLMAASGVPGALVSTMPSRLMLVSRGWQEGHPLTHEIQVVYAVVGQRLVVQARQERDL